MRNVYSVVKRLKKNSQCFLKIVFVVYMLRFQDDIVKIIHSKLLKIFSSKNQLYFSQVMTKFFVITKKSSNMYKKKTIFW